MSRGDQKDVLVLGASEKPWRYAYQAIKKLDSHGHKVIAIGKSPGTVDEISIYSHQIELESIHTVTIYLRPSLQKEYYDYITTLSPQRVIFNPGSENNELEKLLKSQNMEVLNACTLVMLSTNQF